MTTFDYFGCKYGINDDNETVSLIDATQAKGKFFIPSEVEYNGKSYSVTGLEWRKVSEYKWLSDKRKTNGGSHKYDCMTSVPPFTSWLERPSSSSSQRSENKEITSVIIPDSVKELCICAFYATSLEEINIPTSVTEIPGGCFEKCSNLKQIKLHEGITRIRMGAFEYCSNLKHIKLPEGIVTIGEKAFKSSALTEIEIPSSVKEIEKGVFSNCENLTKVTIPSSIEKIAEEAFCYCSSLTEITIPSSVKTIDCRSFGNCKALKVVNILNEEGAVIIHPNAFPDEVKINYLGKKKAAEKDVPTKTSLASKLQKTSTTDSAKPKAEPKPAAEKTEQAADREGRQMWVERSSEQLVSLGEKMLNIVNSAASSKYELRYTNSYIGLGANGKPSNFAWFIPKKKDLQVNIKVKQDPAFDKILNDKFPGNWAYKGDLYSIHISTEDTEKEGGFFKKLLGMAKSDIEALKPILQEAEKQFKK